MMRERKREAVRNIIRRKENPFLVPPTCSRDSESEDEVACRLPDLEKDDFAARRADEPDKANSATEPTPLRALPRKKRQRNRTAANNTQRESQ